MKNPLKNIYTSNKIFYGIGILVLIFAFGFAFPVLVIFGKILLLLFILIIAIDLILLFLPSTKIECERSTIPVFSLHDENSVFLKIKQVSQIQLHLLIIDDIPYQFQLRNFSLSILMKPGDYKELEYKLKPFKRGKYTFQSINIYASTSLNLMQRRFLFEQQQEISVYPSIIQMKKYELYTMHRIAFFDGVKKMRRIGHSFEFDQIKKYVRGDDIRSINWKATGRTGELMVNHYEDEKAQQIFCIIDKSRTMKMPFDDLSLMDYAINSSLVISNIAMRKEDKTGLITFSNTIGTSLQAEKHRNHLKKILDALYNEKEKYTESNYELLYLHIRNIIKIRSLLFLYTNFESFYAIERVVQILRKINKMHLLVVIFFENEEVIRFGKSEAKHIEDIYLTTIAQKFTAEKKLIRQELTKYGIQTIITTPADLSINTINKYLELKARGLI